MFGGAMRRVVKRQHMSYSYARFVGATLGVVEKRGVQERRYVWWSDARCATATRAVVVRRKVWLSDARSSMV